MIDTPKTEMIASQNVRLGFERIAGYGLAGVVFIYATVGLISKELCDRVVALAPALSTLAAVLAGVMGASWFRGHMDERIANDRAP